MYGTPPCIPGIVQTNIPNSAEEKWALLDKDIAMEDSETENENRIGREHSQVCSIENRGYIILLLGMCSFQHKWESEHQLYLFVLLHHVIMK